MEEKILIKSEIDELRKKITLIASIAFGSVFLITLWVLMTAKAGYYRRTYFELIFRDEVPTFIFILSVLCLVGAIIGFVTYFSIHKCEITITEQNVRGKTKFGKEVVLPIYMISSYSTGKILSTITVATSSGVTKFSLIKNYAEVGNILSQKINERQADTKTTANAPAAAPQPQTSSMDDLLKLKSLLDSGIITAEEFEAKKKQLLGL